MVLNNASPFAGFSGVDTAGVVAPALEAARAKMLAKKTFLFIAISISQGKSRVSASGMKADIRQGRSAYAIPCIDTFERVSVALMSRQILAGCSSAY